MGRRIPPVPGSRHYHTWEHRPEYRKGNGGWGYCNTGSSKPTLCCLGGTGCDVDHVTIKRMSDPPTPRNTSERPDA